MNPVTLADVMEKMRQMYEAIGRADAVELTSADIDMKHFISVEGSIVGVKADWNFEKQASGIALNAIHVLAVFHTYVLEYAKAHGTAPAQVTQHANSCNDIWIVRDLDNNDKHPATENNRSGLWPIIRNIQPTMHLGNGPIEFNFLMAPNAEVRTNGATRGVTAEIVNNKTGYMIGELITILNGAALAWDEFLRTNRVI